MTRTAIYTFWIAVFGLFACDDGSRQNLRKFSLLQGDPRQYVTVQYQTAVNSTGDTIAELDQFKVTLPEGAVGDVEAELVLKKLHEPYGLTQESAMVLRQGEGILEVSIVYASSKRPLPLSMLQKSFVVEQVLNGNAQQENLSFVLFSAEGIVEISEDLFVGDYGENADYFVIGRNRVELVVNTDGVQVVRVTLQETLAMLSLVLEPDSGIGELFSPYPELENSALGTATGSTGTSGEGLSPSENSDGSGSASGSGGTGGSDGDGSGSTGSGDGAEPDGGGDDGDGDSSGSGDSGIEITTNPLWERGGHANWGSFVDYQDAAATYVANSHGLEGMGFFGFSLSSSPSEDIGSLFFNFTVVAGNNSAESQFSVAVFPTDAAVEPSESSEHWYEVKANRQSYLRQNFLPTGSGSHSVDISALVQSIVDRPGWVSGNTVELVVYCHDESGSYIHIGGNWSISASPVYLSE